MLTFALALVLVTSSLDRAYTNDIKEPYFTRVTLECEDNSVNLTNYNSANLQSRYWIFPSGVVYQSTDNVPTCGIHKCFEMDPSNFNVTINRINDDDFGVYYCVLVMKDHSLRVIRKGLNVDGAYYGDLLEKYKENAKVGGIAAAVLFVIVGGSCFLWNCRYNKRKSKRNQQNGGLTDINMVRGYDNTAADVGMDEKL